MKKFVIIWMNGEVVTMEDEKKKEIVEIQENYMRKLTDRINEQILEITELHKKNSLIYQQIGDLEQKLAGKDDQIQDLKSKQKQILEEKDRLLADREVLIKKLKNENKKKEKQLQDHKKKIKELSEENDQLLREVKEHTVQEGVLSEKIVQMENSKSWKITKPLRALYWKSR